MRKLVVAVVSLLAIAGCKNCIECQYATQKGTEYVKYCSSTKQDRVDFENEIDSLAALNGSKAYCDKVKY